MRKKKDLIRFDIEGKSLILTGEACTLYFVSCVFSVYDTLSGNIVRRLEGHRSCVRDVSWHPFENNIMTSSVSISCIEFRIT